MNLIHQVSCESLYYEDSRDLAHSDTNLVLDDSPSKSWPTHSTSRLYSVASIHHRRGLLLSSSSSSDIYYYRHRKLLIYQMFCGAAPLYKIGQGPFTSLQCTQYLYVKYLDRYVCLSKLILKSMPNDRDTDLRFWPIEVTRGQNVLAIRKPTYDTILSRPIQGRHLRK